MNSLAPPGANVLIAYGCVLAVLLAGSGVSSGLARLHPERDYRELRLRVRTWWLIVPPLVIALALGPLAVALLFALASGIALREFLNLAGLRELPRAVATLAWLAVPLQYLLAWRGSAAAFVTFVPLYGLLLACGLALAKPPGAALRAAAGLGLGLLLAVASLSHVARLGAAENGSGLVVFLLMVTQLNDVAQYVWGKLLGRRALAPRLSPGKTREGLLGGLATSAALAALLAPLLTPLDAAGGALAGVALALAGVAGDLTVSALKRRAGVKDAGRLLPGHGGLLDRVDSLIFAAPLFAHAMLMFY